MYCTILTKNKNCRNSNEAVQALKEISTHLKISTKNMFLGLEKMCSRDQQWIHVL